MLALVSNVSYKWAALPGTVSFFSLVTTALIQKRRKVTNAFLTCALPFTSSRWTLPSLRVGVHYISSLFS